MTANSFGDLLTAHRTAAAHTPAAGNSRDGDLGDTGFGAVDHQFAVGDRRSLGDAELIHILPRHLDPQIGQVRSRAAEIFGQGHELLGADLGPQAGCPFDLHEQLVRVDRPGTHLLR